MTRAQRPSRFVLWCLRALMPHAESDALIGDLNEELIRHAASSRAPAWPAFWLEWRAWRYILAVAPKAIQLSGRSLWHVVRDAMRALRSAPGATAGTIAILTLGISAATVTFSVVDTVVLRPLPFDASHELAVVEFPSDAEAPWPSLGVGPHQYLTLRSRLTTFDSLAAVARMSRITLSSGGEPERIETAQVNANLFETLRVRPFIGQVFTAKHEVAGNHHVAVISHELWQRRFGGDPAIVGRPIAVTRTMTFGGVTTEESLTVLGVMPRGFTYPMKQRRLPEIWTPYVMTADELVGANEAHYLHVVGRLRSTASRAQAQAESAAVAASLSETNPDPYRTRQFRVVSLKDTLVDDVRGWMLLVLGAVAVVMLIACVNVANLQLVRATRRARELSIRASLGATRRQLVASLLVESLMLAGIAALLAIVVAVWGIQAAKAALPADLVRLTDIGLDVRVLTATIAAAVGTGFLFGVVPAWQASREDLVALLKQGTLTMGIGRRRWRAAFVIAEVAFVSALLVGATLIISSFVRVTTADLGFDRSNLLYVRGTSVGAEETAAVVDRLRSLPGVTAVGSVANGSPPLAQAGFGGGASGAMIRAADALPDTEPLFAEFRRVSQGYFAAAGIAIVDGHVFDDGDAARQTAVIIDESTALALFGLRDAVGAELTAVGPPGPIGRRTVAAVVRHVHLNGPEQTAAPQIYLPTRIDQGGSDFLVRTSQPPATVIPAIRAVFPARPTGPAPLEILPINDAFRNITADRRFNAGLMSIFGVLAIVIGAAGIYGVMASVVAQQTREMGLRVALGATTGRIVTGVLTQAGRYLVVGLVIGLAAAWWVSKGIESILFEVRPTDVVTYGIVVGVMVTTGLLAAWVPARRAARVDPIIVLRSE